MKPRQYHEPLYTLNPLRLWSYLMLILSLASKTMAIEVFVKLFGPELELTLQLLLLAIRRRNCSSHCSPTPIARWISLFELWLYSILIPGFTATIKCQSIARTRSCRSRSCRSSSVPRFGWVWLEISFSRRPSMSPWFLLMR